MPLARKVLQGPELQKAHLPTLELETQAAVSVSILQISLDRAKEVRGRMCSGNLSKEIEFALKIGPFEFSPGINTKITADTPLYQFVLQHFLHALPLES